MPRIVKHVRDAQSAKFTETEVPFEDAVREVARLNGWTRDLARRCLSRPGKLWTVAEHVYFFENREGTASDG